jgi:hypothetical protein
MRAFKITPQIAGEIWVWQYVWTYEVVLGQGEENVMDMIRGTVCNGKCIKATLYSIQPSACARQH